MNLMLRGSLRTARSLALAALVLVLSSCTAGPPPPQPAALPGASERDSGDPLTGAALTRAQHTVDDLRSRLEQHYESPWDADWYTLPAYTTWDAMTEHYEAELGPDWEVDPRYPEGGPSDPGYRCRVWSDGDRAAAIALNVGDAGGGRVLTVLVPDSDR